MTAKDTKTIDPATDPATDPAPVAAEAAGVGALVELHDGAYAIVLTVDPVTVLRLGVPQRHDLPFARKVG